MDRRSRHRRGAVVAAVVVLAGLAVAPPPLPVPGHPTTSTPGSEVRLLRSPFDPHLERGGGTPDELTASATSTTTPPPPSTTEHHEPPPPVEPEPAPPVEEPPAEPPPPPEYEVPSEPEPEPALPEYEPEPVVDDWMAVFNETASSLPGYYSVEDKGVWGATQLSTGAVFIARRTPLVHLRSVMLHEAAHVLQGRRYGGYYQAQDALAAYGGIEVTADCKALEWGATWVNYGCTAAGREGAGLF